MATLYHTRARLLCAMASSRPGARSDWKHDFLLQSMRRIPTEKHTEGENVTVSGGKFNGFLCLDKPTSKSTSGRQLHPQKGPWIFSTGSVCSFVMMNLGENGCHCCTTYPTVLPGGDCTSSWGEEIWRYYRHTLTQVKLESDSYYKEPQLVLGPDFVNP